MAKGFIKMNLYPQRWLLLVGVTAACLVSTCVERRAAEAESPVLTGGELARCRSAGVWRIGEPAVGCGFEDVPRAQPSSATTPVHPPAPPHASHPQAVLPRYKGTGTSLCRPTAGIGRWV